MPLNKIIVSLLILLLVMSGEMKSQSIFDGIYYIGGDKEYETISDAVDSLIKYGISGPVEFKIDSGTYEGDFTIDYISGISDSDTIVFTSQTLDSNDVVIVKELSSTNNYLVKLDGCEYVTFKKITFKTESDSLFNQIVLTKGASYNRFENCVFNAKVEEDCDSENYTYGIVIQGQPSGEKQEFNKFLDNKIIGGCIGISLEGETNELEKGNEIIGNHFTNQKESAVEVVHNSEGYFNNNTVIYEDVHTAVKLNVDSIYEVQGNRIYSGGNRALFIDSFIAQDVNPDNPKGLKVFNNMISCPRGTAFEGNNINGAFFGHNTLINYSSNKSTMTLDSISNFFSLYNLVVNRSSAPLFEVKHLTPPFGSDYNGVFQQDTSGDFGTYATLYDTVTCSSLSEWKAAPVIKPDPRSSFGTIKFQNDSFDLELICGTAPSMRYEGYGDSLKKIEQGVGSTTEYPFETIDINGKTRSKDDFWVGAFQMENYIDVMGYITDGIDTLNGGDVKVFVKKTNTILEEVKKVPIGQNGQYNILDLNYLDYYWLKIIPPDDNTVYVPSYHNGELRWDHFNDSSTINDYLPLDDFCLDTIKDFFPRKLDTLSAGDYTLSGNVSKKGGPNPNKRAGYDPIPGLDVILDQIPPARTVAITQTDVYGNYSFSNLPEDTFIVTIDYQGLPTDTLYKVTLDGGIDSIVNLDYCVDLSKQIEGCPDPIVGKENIQFKDILLYPNPMQETLTISGVSGKFDLSILDARGREIMNLSNQNEYALISTVDLKSGIYFVLIKTFDGNSMYKIIK